MDPTTKVVIVNQFGLNVVSRLQSRARIRSCFPGDILRKGEEERSYLDTATTDGMSRLLPSNSTCPRCLMLFKVSCAWKTSAE